MSKDKISDYSATANSNTDIGGINIDEGCAPSGINDAIRTLMKQLKDWQSGSQDVYIHPAGSASVPSITATGDTNTGIFFPAADTVGITTGGTERARVDSSGNLGLGVTPSAWDTTVRKSIQLGAAGVYESDVRSGYLGNTSIGGNYYYNGGWKYIGSDYATRINFLNDSGNQGIITFERATTGTAGNAITWTTAMTLDASGKLGVATTSPIVDFDVGTGSGLKRIWVGPSATGKAQLGHDGTYGYVGTASNQPLLFTINDAEKVRIDTSGRLLVGTTSTIVNGNAIVQVVGGAGIRAQGTSSGETAVGAFSTSTGATYFYVGYDMTAGAIKYQVLFNGNVQNTNNSYGAISDIKLKENITDATPKLAQLNQVRIVNYNLIGEEQKQIGVIAQELEQIFPGMVEETDDYEEVTTTAEDGTETTERVATGTTTKSVKYSVFVPMLIKSIQEQQAIITQLQADVAALKG